MQINSIKEIAKTIETLSETLCKKVNAGEFKLPLAYLNEGNLIGTNIHFDENSLYMNEVSVVCYNKFGTGPRVKETIYLPLETLETLLD